MSRKQVLLLFLLFFVIVSIALIGCSGEETSTAPTDANLDGEDISNEENDGEEENGTGTGEVEEVDRTDISEFNQSPMLDDMDLPAVEERLPDEPKVTNEMDASQLDYEIGEYGGTLRTPTTVPDWNADVFVMLTEPLINTPGLLGEEVTGNVVKDFEVNADETEFTFYMREGLKWSDGELVTTEDVQFTYEDVLMNEELTVSMDPKYRSGGKPDGDPMQLEVIDEYTFKITFSESYGGFQMRIAIQGWAGYTDLIKPKHYLQQYHVDYADADELEEAISEAGFDEGEWYNLFNEKDITNYDATNPHAVGFPVLHPWVLTETRDGIQTYDRNPYYFKVDKEGNQLPYIDRVQSYLTEDMEMVTLEIISGEIDFTRESAGLLNLPLYKENEESGGYETILLKTHGRPGNVFINQNYDDEVWQAVVQDVRFREALNLGINNDELIDAIYYTFADIPTEYNSGEYNPERAEQLLDEMGLDERGSDGYRLGPDGERFEIYLEVSDRVPETIPQTELLVEYWNDLGLSTSMRTIDNALLGSRIEANEIQVMVERMEDYWWQGNLAPERWAPLWNQYHTSNGEDGEEPPEHVQTLFQKIDETRGESPEVGYEAFQEIQQMNQEHLYFLVTVENAEQPLIVSSRLRNIPHDGTTIAANFAAEQFFFTEEE